MRIGYARSSRADGDVTPQIEALKAAGCERLFHEHVSGRIAERPVLAEVMAFARTGDEVVIWRLDRLARSLRHLLSVADDLKARGIGLRSLTENLDTTTATGALCFNVIGSLVEYEVSLLRERTAHALACRPPGRRGGRPRAMSEAKLSMARALLAEGRLSVHEVAREIGVGTSTLYRAIPAAKGAVGIAA